MTEQTPAWPPASTAASHRKPLWLVVVVASVFGIVIWRLAFATSKVPDNVVVLSGRIVGDDSAISPKTSGRIAEIRFRAGDSVKAGDRSFVTHCGAVGEPAENWPQFLTVK